MKKSLWPVSIPLGALALLLLGALGCPTKEKVASGPEPTPPPEPPRTTRVLLEVDRMEGTPPLQESLPGQAEVSLKKIYADAGIDLDIQQDQTNLPRIEQVRLADLHNLMTSFSSVAPPAGVGKIHALVVTLDAERADTLGIMFDFDQADLNLLPREGFAVFASAHQSLNNPAAEMLLTTAHEMAHCFNLHHPDWEGSGFGSGSTIESYSLTDTVRWALSPHSKKHVREDQANEVWPGQGGLPFGSVGQGHLDRHKSDPAESFSVVDSARAARAPGAGGARRTGLARDTARVHPVDGHSLRLHLEAPKTSFIVGEPVVLTVGLHNGGSSDRYVLPLIDPRYQFLNVEMRKKGTEQFEPFRSAVLADARGVAATRLKPGDSIHEEIKVFFGADGWTFKEPGTFEVRADYPAGGSEPTVLDEREGRVQSALLELEIKAPTTSTDRRATNLMLGYEQGLFIFLEGADHLSRAKAKLRSVVEEAPGSATAPAARLALAQAVLNPAPSPGSRVATQIDVEKAQEYLRGLPSADLPPLSVVRAVDDLAKELEKRGETPKAQVIRRESLRGLEREEAVRDKTRRWRVNRGAGTPR